MPEKPHILKQSSKQLQSPDAKDGKESQNSSVPSIGGTNEGPQTLTQSRNLRDNLRRKTEKPDTRGVRKGNSERKFSRKRGDPNGERGATNNGKSTPMKTVHHPNGNDRLTGRRANGPHENENLSTRSTSSKEGHRLTARKSTQSRGSDQRQTNMSNSHQERRASSRNAPQSGNRVSHQGDSVQHKATASSASRNSRVSRQDGKSRHHPSGRTNNAAQGTQTGTRSTNVTVSQRNSVFDGAQNKNNALQKYPRQGSSSSTHKNGDVQSQLHTHDSKRHSKQRKSSMVKPTQSEILRRLGLNSEVGSIIKSANIDLSAAASTKAELLKWPKELSSQDKDKLVAFFEVANAESSLVKSIQNATVCPAIAKLSTKTLPGWLVLTRSPVIRDALKRKLAKECFDHVTTQQLNLSELENMMRWDSAGFFKSLGPLESFLAKAKPKLLVNSADGTVYVAPFMKAVGQENYHTMTPNSNARLNQQAAKKHGMEMMQKPPKSYGEKHKFPTKEQSTKNPSINLDKKYLNEHDKGNEAHGLSNTEVFLQHIPASCQSGAVLKKHFQRFCDTNYDAEVQIVLSETKQSGKAIFPCAKSRQRCLASKFRHPCRVSAMKGLVLCVQGNRLKSISDRKILDTFLPYSAYGLTRVQKRNRVILFIYMDDAEQANKATHEVSEISSGKVLIEAATNQEGRPSFPFNENPRASSKSPMIQPSSPPTTAMQHGKHDALVEGATKVSKATKDAIDASSAVRKEISNILRQDRTADNINTAAIPTELYNVQAPTHFTNTQKQQQQQQQSIGVPEENQWQQQSSEQQIWTDPFGFYKPFIFQGISSSMASGLQQNLQSEQNNVSNSGVPRDRIFGSNSFHEKQETGSGAKEDTPSNLSNPKMKHRNNPSNDFSVTSDQQSNGAKVSPYHPSSSQFAYSQPSYAQSQKTESFGKGMNFFHHHQQQQHHHHQRVESSDQLSHQNNEHVARFQQFNKGSNNMSRLQQQSNGEDTHSHDKTAHHEHKTDSSIQMQSPSVAGKNGASHTLGQLKSTHLSRGEEEESSLRNNSLSAQIREKPQLVDGASSRPHVPEQSGTSLVAGKHPDRLNGAAKNAPPDAHRLAEQAGSSPGTASPTTSPSLSSNTRFELSSGATYELMSSRQRASSRGTVPGSLASSGSLRASSTSPLISSVSLAGKLKPQTLAASGSGPKSAPSPTLTAANYLGARTSPKLLSLSGKAKAAQSWAAKAKQTPGGPRLVSLKTAPVPSPPAPTAVWGATAESPTTCAAAATSEEGGGRYHANSPSTAAASSLARRAAAEEVAKSEFPSLESVALAKGYS